MENLDTAGPASASLLIGLSTFSADSAPRSVPRSSAFFCPLEKEKSQRIANGWHLPNIDPTIVSTSSISMHFCSVPFSLDVSSRNISFP